jgi:hypothetical protein
MTKMRTRTLMGGLLILTLALAACGGSTPDGAPADDSAPAATAAAEATPVAEAPAEGNGSTTGAIDVTTGRGLCLAISPDLAAAALGSAVDHGKPHYSRTFGSASCTFTAVESTESVKIEYEKTTRDQWETAVDKVGMTDEMLVEVGEMAYQSTDAVFTGGTRLAAFGSGMAIWVVISKEGDQDRVLPAAREIGLALLERMQGL